MTRVLNSRGGEGLSLTTVNEREIVRDMKHMMAVIVASEEDFAAAVAGVGGEEEGALRRTFEMPDGRTIKMGLEQLAPEMLFRPAVWAGETGGGGDEGGGTAGGEGKADGGDAAGLAPHDARRGRTTGVVYGRGVPCVGIPSAVHRCILACDMDIGRDLYVIDEPNM